MPKILISLTVHTWHVLLLIEGYIKHRFIDIFLSIDIESGKKDGGKKISVKVGSFLTPMADIEFHDYPINTMKTVLKMIYK